MLEPSRDLAQQTLDELERFGKYLPEPGLRQLVVVGGQTNKDQEQALEAGVDIVVGTVGRISGATGWAMGVRGHRSDDPGDDADGPRRTSDKRSEALRGSAQRSPQI